MGSCEKRLRLFESFAFAEGVQKISDLTTGMRLPGIVTNVTAFGVFVDIGVHQDGLVHISKLADYFVKDPNDVVKVHEKVWVTVLNIDLERKRISLSMKEGQNTTSQNRHASAKKRPKKNTGSNNGKSERAFFNNPFPGALKGR